MRPVASRLIGECAAIPTLRIDIQDSGCGISPELQEKIFEPFFTTKEKGTGLGLSTVYQLLQSCGGRIEVRSELNCGSTFSLLFPLPKPDDRDEKQLYPLAVTWQHAILRVFSHDVTILKLAYALTPGHLSGIRYLTIFSLANRPGESLY